MTLTTHDIYNVLKTRKPVSIMRAGDGERIVLESNKDIPAYRTCLDNVMKRQMGYEPTMSDVEAIRENLITAYEGADIVGIPQHKNLADLNKHWRGVEDTVKPLCKEGVKFTSTDICYDMLYEGLLTEWLRDKPVVNYIGCRDLDDGFYRLGIEQPNKFIIAPENKFTSYSGEHHYPEQFNRVERWMSKIHVAGNPCLVGAGVIGKIYCNWFRDRGGIAIDVGAVMDLFAGYVTRGPERGLDKECVTYKL